MAVGTRSRGKAVGVECDTPIDLDDDWFRYFRLDLRPEDAELHRRNVIARHLQLVQRLGTEQDIRATAFDYFLQLGVLSEPVVVESTTLRETETLAYQDRLTGVHNYAHFAAELEMEVARSLRYGVPLSLVLIDLDDFKRINDDLGHGAGNDVLATVAELLRKNLRSGDMVARIGGDEFALLLHCADLVTGLRVAARKRLAVEEWFSRSVEPYAPTVTASVGVATVPSQAGSSRELFEVADRALYHAKRQGRNRIAFTRGHRLVSLRGSTAKRLVSERRRRADGRVLSAQG